MRPDFPPDVVMVEISQSEYQNLLNDSRMLKQLIACGARSTKIWSKASRLLRLDFGQ